MHGSMTNGNASAAGAAAVIRKTGTAVKTAVVSVAWIATAAQAGIRVIDDRQRVVELAAPAQTIVSLAPHLTELVFSAGAGARLAGVSQSCDYPPPAKRLPKVSNAHSINYERLAMLAPDLVLAWGPALKPTALGRLETVVRNVYISNPDDFESIAANLDAIGRLSGHAEHAARERGRFLQKVAALKAGAVRRHPPLRVFYLLWHPPPMTVNRNSWISKVIEICGGVNIYAHLAMHSPVLNRETLLTSDAQFVIQSIGQDFDQGVITHLFGRPIAAIYADPDTLQRPSLRLIDGAERICRAVQTLQIK